MAYVESIASELAAPQFRSVAQNGNNGVFQVVLEVAKQPDDIDPYSSSDDGRFYLVTLYLNDVPVKSFQALEESRVTETFGYVSAAESVLSVGLEAAGSLKSNLRDYSQFVAFVPSGYAVYVNDCGNLSMSECSVDGKLNGMMVASSGLSLSEVEMELDSGYGAFILNKNSEILEYNVIKSVRS